MKKGVVLLLTLFFIMAISLLILKNIDDTDVFITKQNYKINNTQVLITIKNTKNEVSKLLKENKDLVDESLEKDFLQNYIPFNIENLNIEFKLSNYDKTDINEIKIDTSQTIENIFDDNNIFDYELFKDVYFEKLKDKERKVETSKQLNDIINTFIIKNNSNNILKIKDKIGFLKSENLYLLDIKVSFNDSKAFAYYILENSGKVQYFDISFK
jgi:hypothetical protein